MPNTAGGHRLDEEFFVRPWDKIGRLITNDVQRAALVEALEGLLTSDTPAVLPAMPRLPAAATVTTAPGGVRRCHPLLDPGGRGQLYLVVDLDGAAPGAAMRLGLAAEAQPFDAGPGVFAELTLLSAAAGTVTAVAGTPEYPLRIQAQAVLSAPGAQAGKPAPMVAVALQLVAPPHLDQSGIRVELHGLGDTPLVLDPAQGGAGIAPLAVGLIQLALGLLGPSVPAPVQAVADHLPGLLGIGGGMTPLPLSELARDPDAMRAWLASLLATAGEAGRPALLSWLDAIAGMLGAAPSSRTVLPDAESPFVIPLLAGPPEIAMTAGVRTAASGGAPELLLGLRISHPGLPGPAGLDARLSADAVLLTVPLAGTDPTVVLERLDVRVEAPAGAGPLVPRPGDAAGAFRLGGLRAGLGYAPGHTVEPLLELDDVTIETGGTTRTFDRLDLTDATSLSGAANQLLDDAIAAGLGTGTDVVTALRTVLGLGTTPAIDIAHFASAPTRALGEYLRALRATANGWPRLLQAIGTLLGTVTNGAGAPPVSGHGTAPEPWRLPLDHFTAPAGSAAELALLLWDEDPSGEPDLRLALALDVPAPAAGLQPEGNWQVSARAEVLGVALPTGGPGQVRWLSGVRLTARCVPGALSALPGGITLAAGALAADLVWSPGSGLGVTAELAGVSISVDGTSIDLGDLHWPPPGGIDLSAADLGLGIDPATLWSALRPLLVHYAESAGGPIARDLLALAGITGPGSTGAARGLPPLDLGTGGVRDLLSEPLEALRTWLAGLALDAEAALPGGQPFIRNLLDAAQAVLTGRTPVLGASPTPQPDLPVQGSGTPADPWTIPLHAAGEPAVELAGWLEPDGPPIDWALTRLTGMIRLERADDGPSTDADADEPDEPTTPAVAGIDLSAALTDIAGYLPAAAAVQSSGPDLVMSALDALADQLAAGDGVADLDSVVVADRDGWRSAVVESAHHLLPTAAAPIIEGEIAQRTTGLAGSDWAVVLLGTPISGPRPWSVLLGGVPAEDIATISLRIPGVPFEQADLGAVGAAGWYDVDLGDDGAANAERALTALRRVVTAIQRAKPGAKVVLVAHSYLGLVAQAYADTEPDAVLALITAGTPVGAEPYVVPSPLVAEGARLAGLLASSGIPGMPAIQDATAMLTTLLSGGTDGHGGQLPANSFTRIDPSALTVHDVPALAVAGQLTGDVRQGLANALNVGVLEAGAGRLLPTHLVWGVRAGLGTGTAIAGEPEADVSVLAELGRFRLAPGAVVPGTLAPDRPAQFQIRAALTRTGGWLVGGPGDGSAMAARIRAAELVATITAGAAGPAGSPPLVTIDARLHDVSLRGDSAITIGLDDPRALDLLARMVEELDVEGITGGRIDAVLGALSDLGVVRRRGPATTAAVLADGLAGLRADASAWSAPRVPGLLDRAAGLLGLTRAPGAPPGGGPWRFAHPRLPVEVLVEVAPWRITVHTTGDGLALGASAVLTATGTVDLASLTPVTDAGLHLAGLSLARDPAGGLAISGTWLDPPLRLTGLTPPDVLTRLGPLLPRILVAAGLGGALEGLIGERITGLGLLLADPGRWLSRTLGVSLTGEAHLPDAARLEDLVRALAAEAGLDGGAAAPLALPGGILVRIDPDGDGLRLSARTTDPVVLFSESGHDATLGIDVHLAVDAARHVIPGGDLTLHLPLPGDWGALDLHLGADPSGAAASIDLTVPGAGAAPDSIVTVTLLPTVSGLERVAGAAAERLLPLVLDELVSLTGARTPRPPVLDDVLAIADQLGIHDAAGGFAAKAEELAGLVHTLTAGAGAGVLAASAAQVVLTRLLGPGLVPAGPPAGSIGVQIPLGFGGTASFSADLSVVPPALTASVAGLTAGPVSVDVMAGYAHPEVLATADVTLRVDTQLGVMLTPALHLGAVADPADPSRIRLLAELRPLGSTGPAVTLAPVPAPPTLADLGALARAWVIPLAGTLAARAASTVIETAIWAGGKSVAGILVDAHVFDRAADGSLIMRATLPDPGQLLHGMLDALTGVAIPLPGGVSLALASDGNRYGIVISGDLTIPAEDISVAIRFGLPATLDVGWGEAGRGSGLLLLDLTDPLRPQLTPVLRLGGLGVRVGASAAGKALIDTSGFRLAAVAAHIRTDLPLTGAAALARPVVLDGAIQLDGLGLPFGGGDNSSNPVAGSMMKSDGTGDAAPVNPPLDVLVGRGNGHWTVQFSGQAEIRFDIHRSFGPLHIEELAILYLAATGGTDPGSVGLSVDGGVALAGLAVDVDDLSLLVPLRAPADVSQWKVDLAGLSLALSAGPVNIAGGLLKATLDDGTIDYEGMLSVDISGRGFTAVGAYARPDDSLGSYTSMFIFVSVPIPIGGPPYLFILGFGGGAGYNRRLLVPRDPAGVPSFPLVAAINGGGPSADAGPMAALRNISQEIPPARGAIWIAAGLKFSTFELLHTTAVAYVTIDHGLEVGLLGLMQMVLPADAAAVVSLELGLAARYSTVDQILSIRAALTANSWLISPDCQVTGGFAFVVWFGRPDVLLTVGGYGPLFTPPDYYPQVPPLGFHWSVGDGIVVKGESYFTLTPAALTFGGRLEASYDVSPVRVWLTVHLDVLIRWDPFAYIFDAGVSVGASFTIKICFFACVRFSVSVSLGANVHIEGPPLHAIVTVDLAIARVTVEFGEKQILDFLQWVAAAAKYLTGGGARPATTASVALGGRPPEGGAAPDGTPDRPWPVAPEFSIRIESVMPLHSWQLKGIKLSDRTGGRRVDVVPCGSHVGQVEAGLTLEIERLTAGTWLLIPAATAAALRPSSSVTGFPAAVWDAAQAGHANAGSSMVTALAQVTLAAGVSISEATGTLREIPFARLIEEETARPLSFGAARAGPAGAVVTPAVLRAASRYRLLDAAPVADAAPAARPARLRAVITRHDSTDGPASGSQALGISAREFALRARTTTIGPAADRPAALPAGGALIWDVDLGTRHRLDLVRDAGRTLPVRVVRLTGTGAIASDGVARSGSVLPEGASRVVALPAETGDAGWDSATELIPAAMSTLLAIQATVRLPRPWTAPARYARLGEHTPVPAPVVVAGQDGVITDLPGGLSTVVVLLDRTDPGAALTQVTLTFSGADPGRRRTSMDGQRALIVVPVSAADGARGISVQVSAPGWQLASVQGRDGAATDVARTLRTQPWSRMNSAAGSGAPVAIGLNPLSAAGRRL